MRSFPSASRSSRPIDRITVVRRFFRLPNTDESVDRLVVTLTASVRASPSSSRRISGKLSSSGNARSAVL